MKVICKNSEDKEFLKKLVENLKTQDTITIKKPVIYDITDVAYIKSDEEHSEYEEIYLNETEKTYTISDLYKLNEALERYNLYLQLCSDMKEVWNILAQNCISADIYYYTKYFKMAEKLFITEEAAKKYLEEHEEDYTNEAFVYCRHEDENSELGMLLKILEGCEII